MDETPHDVDQPAPAPVPATVTSQADHGASQQLVDKAQAAFEQGDPESALADLERAIALAPDNGEAYYWLCEVWRARGQLDQAWEYHDLADRHLANERFWQTRLERQAQVLERTE